MATTTISHPQRFADFIQSIGLVRAVTCVCLFCLLQPSSAQTAGQAGSVSNSQPLNAAPQTGIPQQAAPQTSQTGMGSNGMVLDQSLILGPGDLIDMQVFGTPELSPRLRVDQQGYISVPFSGKVNVNGLTAAETATAIEGALRRAQVMLDPHVTVFVQQYASQGITVLGEVRLPGTYPLYGTHSLYDALAAAGGATANEGETITISRRQDPDHPVEIPVTTPNFSVVQRTTQVQPGDLILVSQAPKVYVVGEVGRPGVYYMTQGQNLKLLSLIALVGGVGSEAASSKASIVRPTATGAITIPVNLSAILKNKMPNLALQASDVLVVPRSPGKVFRDLALPSLTNAVLGAVSTALVIR